MVWLLTVECQVLTDKYRGSGRARKPAWCKNTVNNWTGQKPQWILDLQRSSERKQSICTELKYLPTNYLLVAKEKKKSLYSWKSGNTRSGWSNLTNERQVVTMCLQVWHPERDTASPAQPSRWEHRASV